MENYTAYERFKFSVTDYFVFFFIITAATATGIYFGFYKRHEPDEDDIAKPRTFGAPEMSEYLLGSRQMNVFPVAMSLVGSYISGVTMLGTPSEVYNFGTQYCLILFAIMLSTLTVAYVYIPVFAVTRVGSSYQYLQFRFGSSVRGLASIMFLMDEIFFLPMIVYVPALALNQVTQIHLHVATSVIIAVTVAYTLLGGIKAVIHTDAWQILVMFIAAVIVVIIGTIHTDGPGNVINAASKGGRIILFNTSLSFYERHTLWAVLIGGYSYWTSFNSVNQTMVQRYLSLPSIPKMQRSIAIFSLGILGFLSVCCFTGLLIFEFYQNCDPKTKGLVTQNDQLLPLYVMQVSSNYWGVPGLFVGGVFGAALSSLSTVLNSTSLVLYEDFFKGFLGVKPSDRVSIILVKGQIIVLGVIAFSLVFVLERLSGILSVTTTLTAIAASTTFGIFTLGMLNPYSNTKGVLIGGFCGVTMTMIVSGGSQYVRAMEWVVDETLPVTVEACIANYTMPHDFYDPSNIFPLFRISFHWISPIGVLTTIIVGTIASFIIGATDPSTLSADLLSPVIHSLLPAQCFENQFER